jgi:3-phosphoshikimate 1-carboxyvinyltransferase
MPGDKSISHRYAMLGAIADGTTRLRNFSSGLDCASTLNCVRALGAQVETENEDLTITSQAWREPSAALDCGNSGSTMRMLAGLLAGQNIACELIGDHSLSRRPMRRIIEPLQQMGAKISSADGRPPLRIARGGSVLRGITYQPPVPSAQVKSSLLFAGLFAEGTTTVTEDVRTRDHGELALRAFGAKVDRTRNSVSIAGGQRLSAIQAYVPGDVSSAAFFLCLAALFPDSNLVLDAVGMNPTRSAVLDVLSGFGARVSVVNLEEQHGELVGTLRVQGGQLRGGLINGPMSARLIDELPLLAAIAPLTTQGIEIRDAQELRVKESDRIACTAENLRRMGAEVIELEDGLRVPGDQKLHGAELETFGDHRIGMAFAIAASRAKGESLIRDAEAVAVSFPEFWDFLDRVTS